MPLTCAYCKVFHKSRVINTKSGFDHRECLILEEIKEEEDKKKRNKKYVDTAVTPDSPACDAFERVKWFFCINYGCRVNLQQCMGRRVSSLSSFSYCSKCRQFEKEIKYLIVRRRKPVKPTIKRINLEEG